ncbi:MULTISPECIES: D-alanyl-D-alanine carboxypeptidase [unclassified Phenylobacterium]|uniref:D-alanyl-D-alanine carboxypeptidase n=1 Tax=unclassified Phenylobacterium TaxID=2640670 RepID=UPI00083B1195|nr:MULTISPECIES: D-alanyl-D-alanine carboxypeptidase [unclassified Phenylobacterium]
MIQHARRLLLTLGLAAATALGGASSPAMAQVPYFQLIPQNSSKYAAIVVDAKTGEVLYAKRADAPRYPASITKVMTLYLAFEALASGKIQLDDPVVFSPRASAQAPTKLGIRAGDSITVEQAMQGMVTRSANDAAVALAEKLGGTEQRFATLMTLRAQELGMSNTNFANPHGLPDSRNLSTARDLAILSRAVMRDYPQYYRLFSTKNFAFRGQNIRNHNGLLYTMDGVDGLKTGFTNASGFNLAVSAVRDNRRLIAIVLGGPTVATRNKVAEGLLLTGFDVLDRRARGEQITVAQNFFEPPQLAEATQPSMQQGDTEAGLKVALASSTPPSRASKIQIVEPRDVPKLNGKGKKDAAGRWTVQVGTFSTRADAREQIALVEKRFGKQFDDARGVAEKDGGKYRARFSGMSEGDARNACKALKAKKQPCLVMPPGRG